MPCLTRLVYNPDSLNIEKLAHFERDSRTDHRESVIEVGL